MTCEKTVWPEFMRYWYHPSHRNIAKSVIGRFKSKNRRMSFNSLFIYKLPAAVAQCSGH